MIYAPLLVRPSAPHDLPAISPRYVLRQSPAMIGDSANDTWIDLHRALGFNPAELPAAMRWKVEHWFNGDVMQRNIGHDAGIAVADPLQ